jgi:FkbM family methyltransferase
MIKDYIKRKIGIPNNYCKKSYSQSGEDLIVHYILNSIGLLKPSYLDIGAHHPMYISNTALFYEMGCTGINIEPDPTLFKEFIKYRNRDINLNVGIGLSDGIIDFYMMSTSTLNTFSLSEAEELVKKGYSIVSKVKVPVLPLKDILDKYFGGRFPDFMSLDVEGLDMEILQSIDYESPNVPIVICVETISFSESGAGIKNHEIIQFLQGKGYLAYGDTNINTIFVKEEKWRR